MELLYLAAFAVLALLVGAIAGAVAGAQVIRGAGPVATAEALAELGKLRLEWQAWKTGAEAILGELEDVAEVVERKRRRVAARESNERKREEEQQMDPRIAMRRRARELGHPV